MFLLTNLLLHLILLLLNDVEFVLLLLKAHRQLTVFLHRHLNRFGLLRVTGHRRARVLNTRQLLHGLHDLGGILERCQALDATTGDEPGCQIQVGLLLLREQLGRIRHLHVNNIGLRTAHRRKEFQVMYRVSRIPNGSIAHRAHPNLETRVVNRNHTTRRTDRDRSAIRTLHVRFPDKRHTTMRNNRITIHFTDLQATLCAATARGLMRTNLLATLTTRIPLVLHHVLQTHAIDGSNENRRLQLLSRRTIVHHFIAVLFKAHRLKNRPHRLLR